MRQAGIEASLQEWLLGVEVRSWTKVLQGGRVVRVAGHVAAEVLPACLRFEHRRAGDGLILLLLGTTCKWRRAAASWTRKHRPAGLVSHELFSS